MTSSETSAHGNVEATASTRHPTQLAVLLASAGSPPFDAQRAALAASRLFDAFVLAPGRKELFVGPRALFSNHAGSIDPRHDALARLLRAIGFSLRSRIDAHESLSNSRDLVRGVAGLAPARIEGILSGFDTRRGAASLLTAELMVGSDRLGTDPIEALDAGVIRRLLALSLRGAMASKPARTSGLVTDLGGAMMVLAALDLAANPRSALRAARGKVARAVKLAEDESAWPKDVGQALRECIGQAIASASPAGSTGRELTREPALPSDLLEAFAVSLALAVYNGFVPIEEHPLVVPGVAPREMFTSAPVAVGPAVAAVGSPVLGLFAKISFVPLPFAPIREDVTVGAPSAGQPPPIPLKGKTPVSFDEAMFVRAREAVRSPTRPLPPMQVLTASLDPFDPEHTFDRGTLDNFAGRLSRQALGSEPSTQVVILVGPRSNRARDALASLGKALLTRGTVWHVLAPKPETRTLSFVGLLEGVASLRRADISRWVGTDLSRSVEFNVDPGANIVINAAALEWVNDETAGSIAALCSDVADRAMPRSLVVLLGATDYRAAATLAAAIGQHAELETSEVPLRGGMITMLRVDAPALLATVSHRPVDEALLSRICEPYAGGLLLADLAARTMLAPAEARFRAQFARIVTLALSPDGNATGIASLPADIRGSISETQRAVARGVADPLGGASTRRALQAGVCAQHSARAALSTGMLSELAECARTEVALNVAEYFGAKAATHIGKLEAVGRAAVTPWLLAANARSQLVLSDSAVGAAEVEGFEWHSVASAWLAASFGAKSVALLDSSVTLILKAPLLDVLASVAVSVGSAHARPAMATPMLSIEWVLAPSREATLGVMGSVVAALSDACRRVINEHCLRTQHREGRNTLALLFEVVTDACLSPERVKMLIPFAVGGSDALRSAIALEIGARLASAIGTDPADEWSATVLSDNGENVVVPLSEALLTRECASRWVRALRALPRWFPQEDRTDEHYAEAPVIATAAELGLLSTVLVDRKIAIGSAEARAITARLQPAAEEIVSRAREIAESFPVVERFTEGSARDVIERTLIIAWFLQVNFCCSIPGGLHWNPAGMVGDPEGIARWLDFDRLRAWIGRKVNRPDTVARRVEDLLRTLTPRIVVDR